KRTAAVGDGAAHNRVLPLRTDDALLNGGISLRSRVNSLSHLLPCGLSISDRLHELQQVGMNDEAVVIIGVVVRPIAIGAVAQIPVHMLAQSVVDAETVPVAAKRFNSSF